LILPALAAGAHRRRLQVLVLHLDVDLVLDVRRDLHGRERRLPARVRIERRDAHQAVHAVLAAHVAEGVVAADAEARTVDPCLVPLLVVDHLGLVPAPLRPAQVHAEQHLRPVLRVVAAGAGVDAHDRVGVIDRPREHPRQLRRAHARFERRRLRRRLGDGRLVVLGGPEVQQDDRVVQVPRQLLDPADLLFERSTSPRDHLRLLLVLPESGRERLLLELVYLRLELRQVKDAPLAP
jgi:hypothetical protein